MGRIPGFLLRHSVGVERYQGTWGSFGPVESLRCFVDEKMASAAYQAGVTRVSLVTVYCAPEAVVPAGSRVTLADGRVGYAQAVINRDGGGLPTPDHVEVAVAVGSQYGPAFGETVVLLRRTATGRDAYNNDRYTTVEIQIAGAAVRVLSSQENLGEARDKRTDSVEVVFPPGTDVKATDAMRIRGLVYEIDGTPDTQYAPTTGVQPGVRVVGRRVVG